MSLIFEVFMVQGTSNFPLLNLRLNDFYGDFRNPRTEIRQKKLLRKKINLKGFFRILKCPKISILDLKINMNDYIISQTLFSEKARQII